MVFGIHRERFFDLGGFDEAFTGYGAEDTDFGFRAREVGLPLLFMGGPGAFHQHHDSFEPPLQHLDDIVRNANVFRVRWDRWPMEGWLAAFQKLGLVLWEQDRLSVHRRPTDEEIAHARTEHAA
ncbi:glycosyltransferase family 2 protein [Novosphingobium sp. ST904]|uniref:glycosyltransferase family 2 protein n=1 Tax=Novosphingobium sp. ST904 TaxID=1684385 RepID=UPI001E52E511|nr:galactosyltransferase-related protein [Novosphingobium sp. ST904]